MPRSDSVSFVVPVHNGARWIADVIASIEAQADGRPMEIVVVDDASTDASVEIVEEQTPACPLRSIPSDGRGLAAALNTGIRAARFPIICQVDQDVVLSPGWMRTLVEELDDPSVGAVQGRYTAAPDADLFARVMDVDLAQRHAAIRDGQTDHVCTGNTAYRAEALHRVGLFDERFGYGLDNDLSYRMRSAGYRLVFTGAARSTHHWRTGLVGYARGQYGLGYGRLDLVAKHPSRVGGDTVSPLLMMLHPAMMTAALSSLAVAGLLAATAHESQAALWVATGLTFALIVERAAAGIRAARRFGEPAALLFPIVHLVRDAAWVVAIGVWSVRRLLARPQDPADSLYPRPQMPVTRGRLAPAPSRILVLIPAHNEAATLPAVIAELRNCHQGLDLLVIDDGSTDSTSSLVRALGVRWLRLPERMGVGSAIRAGLRYASRLGYDGAVRVDGDGQHRADDIDRVLAPLRQGEADVVLGSRYTPRAPDAGTAARVFKRVLAACLSRLTGRAVTDPTSGFCALGPRAVELLAEHHPTGYPEPELHLLLGQHGLRAVEVPVRSRPRLGGRTSLTPWRLVKAGARVALAMLIVPLRGAIRDTDRD